MVDAHDQDFPIRVLVVDDEDGIRLILEEGLGPAGFAVQCAGSVAEARRLLCLDVAAPPAEGGGDASEAVPVAFDLVLSDKNLPDGSGLDLARALVERNTDCEFVLMTGFANLDSAVEAFGLGVADYVVKPFDSIEGLATRLRRVANMLALERRNRELVRELQAKNSVLEGMVMRDSLTGLYNHAFLQEFIEREIVRSRRTGLELGLMLLDIDSFKELNDVHGHGTGDRILRKVSEIIGGSGRASDFAFRLNGSEIAARYAGDVLALVLPETPRGGVATRAERLRAHIERYDFAAENLPPVTISLGVAGFPSDGATRAEVVAAADTALQAAKRGGRNRMIAFSPSLVRDGMDVDEIAKRELGRSTALDRSIREQAFRFVYQPIVDARTTTILAYEALCRPSDPAFSSPIELIGAAEIAGRMVPLGRALREVAVGPLDRLPEPALLFLNIHPLELSEKLLEDEPLVLPWAKRIVLEITENMALKNFQHLKQVLARLKKRGFRIALDDLGAGYASLNSLALLEPDFVKLDMEMLRGIHSDSRSARLIKHILEFTREEGMRVVAEGIETAEERDVVRDLGCHMLQGYYFSKPAEPFTVDVGG